MYEVLKRRVSSAGFDAQFSRLIGVLSGVAILPAAVIALSRHSASKMEFGLGLGLAVVLALQLVTLGMLSARIVASSLPARGRWPEFGSGIASIGIMIGGIASLARLGGSPAQITLGVLMVSALGVVVVVLGMLTTVLRAHRV